MKTEPNEAIHPFKETVQVEVPNTGFEIGHDIYHAGLTKRELMAIEFTKATMIGIITASGNLAHGWSENDFAKAGAGQADALIRILNEEVQ